MSLSLDQFRQRAMVDAYVPPDTYDALPESIKAIVSPQEYAWLSAAEKHRLVQDITEPDPES
jgi:hypothetical protein